MPPPSKRAETSRTMSSSFCIEASNVPERSSGNNAGVFPPVSFISPSTFAQIRCHPSSFQFMPLENVFQLRFVEVSLLEELFQARLVLLSNRGLRATLPALVVEMSLLPVQHYGMKVAAIIARVLLGLMFVVFGSNIFLHF